MAEGPWLRRCCCVDFVRSALKDAGTYTQARGVGVGEVESDSAVTYPTRRSLAIWSASGNGGAVRKDPPSLSLATGIPLACRSGPARVHKGGQAIIFSLHAIR